MVNVLVVSCSVSIHPFRGELGSLNFQNHGRLWLVVLPECDMANKRLSLKAETRNALLHFPSRVSR